LIANAPIRPLKPARRIGRMRRFVLRSWRFAPHYASEPARGFRRDITSNQMNRVKVKKQ
jgi:hypothetical protein